MTPVGPTPHTCEGLYKLGRRQLPAPVIISVDKGLSHRLKDIPVDGLLPIVWLIEELCTWT